MKIHYDGEADFLEIMLGEPSESYYEDIGDDVFENIDRKTEQIKGFTIFNFKKRTEKQMDIDVSLPVELQVIS